MNPDKVEDIVMREIMANIRELHHGCEGYAVADEQMMNEVIKYYFKTINDRKEECYNED